MTNSIRNIFKLEYPHPANRIDLYDFLRGLAMLLVLLQHCVVPGWEYICVFHMPLFFFLSGLVSGNKELPSLREFAFLRFKRLMIVYFVFGLFDVTLYYLLGLVTHKPYNILMAILGVATGQYGFVPDAFSGIYWFLMVMFVADLMIYPIKKYFRNHRVALLGGAVLFLLLSYVSTHYYPIPLFTIDKSFMAAAFLLFGGFCKPLAQYLADLKLRWGEVFTILLGVIGICFSRSMNNHLVLMYLNQYGDYQWFLMGAFSGIIAALLLGKHMYILFSRRKGLFYRLTMWIGFNSLVLFPVHLEVKQYFVKLYGYFGINHWFLLLITMLLISIPICNFITYYMPWVLGQSKKK